MTPALLRIAQQMREAEMAAGERAYAQLKRVASEGGDLTMPDHDLVQAISRAVWAKELATAQLGLTELEIRTAPNAVLAHERAA